MLHPNELIDRWKSPTGAAIRERVIIALMSNIDPRPILKELPGAIEVYDWLDLRGIDISHLSFSSDLFVAASLDFACMDYCEFKKGTFFDNAHLLYASFNHAKFFGAQITEAMVLHASFEHATFEKALLMGSNLSNSSFRGASLIDSDLGRCRCACNDFSGSVLRSVNFSEALLAHVNFAEAKASGCNFEEARRIHATVLPKQV